MKIISCNECNYCGEVELCSSICPKCGSNNINANIALSEILTLSEAGKLKVKEVGYKKCVKEVKFGDDYNFCLNKIVNRMMVVDRKFNEYYEEVVEKENGNIIHKCSERLDQHFGHGNAKIKK